MSSSPLSGWLWTIVSARSVPSLLQSTLEKRYLMLRSPNRSASVPRILSLSYSSCLNPRHVRPYLIQGQKASDSHFVYVFIHLSSTVTAYELVGRKVVQNAKSKDEQPESQKPHTSAMFVHIPLKFSGFSVFLCETVSLRRPSCLIFSLIFSNSRTYQLPSGS